MQSDPHALIRVLLFWVPHPIGAMSRKSGSRMVRAQATHRFPREFEMAFVIPPDVLTLVRAAFVGVGVRHSCLVHNPRHRGNRTGDKKTPGQLTGHSVAGLGFEPRTFGL